jgi:hypothetical protein
MVVQLLSCFSNVPLLAYWLITCSIGAYSIVIKMDSNMESIVSVKKAELFCTKEFIIRVHRVQAPRLQEPHMTLSLPTVNPMLRLSVLSNHRIFTPSQSLKTGGLLGF